MSDVPDKEIFRITRDVNGVHTFYMYGHSEPWDIVELQKGSPLRLAVESLVTRLEQMEYEDDHSMVLCPECEGKGTNQDESGECEICDGEGYVPLSHYHEEE